jgi:hypothetical protein
MLSMRYSADRRGSCPATHQLAQKALGSCNDRYTATGGEASLDVSQHYLELQVRRPSLFQKLLGRPPSVSTGMQGREINRMCHVRLNPIAMDVEAVEAENGDAFRPRTTYQRHGVRERQGQKARMNPAAR